MSHRAGRSRLARHGIRPPQQRTSSSRTCRFPRPAAPRSSSGRKAGRIHIVDPRTGYPAQGTSAVSVLAPRTIDSEAWTKPFFINGRAWASAHRPAGSGCSSVRIARRRGAVGCREFGASRSRSARREAQSSISDAGPAGRRIEGVVPPLVRHLVLRDDCGHVVSPAPLIRKVHQDAALLGRMTAKR